MTHKQNKYRKSSHSRKFIITSELVKSFEVDSNHMPLSSEVKSSRMWPSRWRLTWGRFQPQDGSRFCTAATRTYSMVCLVRCRPDCWCRQCLKWFKKVAGSLSLRPLPSFPLPSSPLPPFPSHSATFLPPASFFSNWTKHKSRFFTA